MNDFNDYIKINELMKAFESKKQMLIVNNHKLKERIENEKNLKSRKEEVLDSHIIELDDLKHNENHLKLEMQSSMDCDNLVSDAKLTSLHLYLRDLQSKLEILNNEYTLLKQKFRVDFEFSQEKRQLIAKSMKTGHIFIIEFHENHRLSASVEDKLIDSDTFKQDISKCIDEFNSGQQQNLMDFFTNVFQII